MGYAQTKYRSTCQMQIANVKANTNASPATVWQADPFHHTQNAVPFQPFDVVSVQGRNENESAFPCPLGTRPFCEPLMVLLLDLYSDYNYSTTPFSQAV